MQNCVCANCAPASIFFYQARGDPTVGRIDRRVGDADEKIRRAADPAPVRQFIQVADADGSRGKSSRIQIENRLGLRLVAGLRIIAAQRQDIDDAERGGAEQLTLQSDPITVAAGQLQDRFNPLLQQSVRGNRRIQMRARAGAVGDIDGIRQAFKGRRLRE